LSEKRNQVQKLHILAFCTFGGPPDPRPRPLRHRSSGGLTCATKITSSIQLNALHERETRLVTALRNIKTEAQQHVLDMM